MQMYPLCDSILDEPSVVEGSQRQMKLEDFDHLACNNNKTAGTGLGFRPPEYRLTGRNLVAVQDDSELRTRSYQ